jgi:hypothetical protein
VLDGPGQRGARDTHQVGGSRDQRCRQRRFQFHRCDGERFGVHLDVGDRLRRIGAFGIVHRHAITDADDCRNRAVSRGGQRHDKLGAGETGHRDGVSLHAPALQRHRHTWEPMTGRVNGEGRHDAAADVGQHVVGSGARDTQHAGGQTDAGQQWNRRDGRTTFLQNNGEIHAAEGAVAVAGGRREFGPAEVDDHLPHRPPALRIRHGLPPDRGRALGAQDVTHAVTQRQLTRIQSDVHKAPNIIKIVN